MKKFTYITLALLLGSSMLFAQKLTQKEIDSNYNKVIILDKGVKRTVLIPKVDDADNKMSSMRAEQATSKDGIVIVFQDPSQMSISAFEANYGVKLVRELASGYYIFTNVSATSDAQIVEDIIKNETNIKTVKPNWRMYNTPQ